MGGSAGFVLADRPAGADTVACCVAAFDPLPHCGHGGERLYCPGQSGSVSAGAGVGL